MTKRELIWPAEDEIVISDFGRKVVENFHRANLDASKVEAQIIREDKAKAAILEKLSNISESAKGPVFGKFGKNGVSAVVTAGEMFSDPIDVEIQIDTWGPSASELAEIVQNNLDGWQGSLLGFENAMIGCMVLPRQFGRERMISEWRLIASDEPIDTVGFGSIFERFNRDVNKMIRDKIDKNNYDEEI